MRTLSGAGPHTRSRRGSRAHPRPGGRAAPLGLARDARGTVAVEYLALVGGIALAVIAIALALRDAYAAGFVARSLTLLGIQ
jgi:Flp pilus assembly pilin Flp